MTIFEINYIVDLLQALIWQYDNATNLKSLVTQKQDWYTLNQSEFWHSWYDDVFNLLTADEFGLSVWASILNLPLYTLAPTEDPSLKPIFGFNAYIAPAVLENSYLNFENSNFSILGTIISLTVEQQRFLLRLRYYQLCSRCDVTDVNEFLDYLCGTSDIGYSGTIYMLDNLDMTITYFFTDPNFPTNLLTIIQTFDVLPKPTGVGVTYSI